MKKELSLKDKQRIELFIMDEIHEFCCNNDIRYSLAYGSMLGAVRHKGFIPWDDDIDVMMPRPDYLKFCKNFKSDRFRLTSIENDKGCFVAFARVHDNKTTIVDTPLPWSNGEVGIWVDIFPVDGTCDTLEKHEKRVSALKKYWQRSVYYRRGGAKFRHFQWKGKLTLSAKKILFLNGYLSSFYIYRLNKKSQQYNWNESSYWGQLVSFDGASAEFLPMNLWNDIVLMEFEGKKYCVCSGYDEILTSQYGDYMQLPPESERIPKGSYYKIYYK